VEVEPQWVAADALLTAFMAICLSQSAFSVCVCITNWIYTVYVSVSLFVRLSVCPSVCLWNYTCDAAGKGL